MSILIFIIQISKQGSIENPDNHIEILGVYCCQSPHERNQNGVEKPEQDFPGVVIEEHQIVVFQEGVKYFVADE